MAEYEILGIGAPFIDHIVRVTPEFEASLEGIKGGLEIVNYSTLSKIIETSGASVKRLSGGSSANTIRTLAHLGHKCALEGKIGTDPAGEWFLKNLQLLGIKSLYIPTSTPTGQAVCLVTSDGERTFRDFLGSGQEMSGKDLAPDSFDGVKLVHIEGYTLLNKQLTLRAMELAKAAKAKVSFDLSNYELVNTHHQQIMHLLSNYVDILFANAKEAEALTGNAPKEGCMFLKSICDTVVVSMNVDGCWVGHKQELIHCNAYPAKAIDSTGAGDLFAAGFLHGYLTKAPLTRCAHYGALIGAEAVKVYGAELEAETWEKLKRSF